MDGIESKDSEDDANWLPSLEASMLAAGDDVCGQMRDWRVTGSACGRRGCLGDLAIIAMALLGTRQVTEYACGLLGCPASKA